MQQEQHYKMMMGEKQAIFVKAMGSMIKVRITDREIQKSTGQY